MNVDKLDDIIEGYSNTFDDSKMVTITPTLHSIQQDTIMFEEDFGTISFTSIIRLDFSNPMHDDFLSA
jgi:hypothetical protein